MVNLLGLVRRWWSRLFGGRNSAEGHEPHTKEVQLGYEPSEDDEDPEMLDDADFDAVWEDATTVEEYERDILALAEMDPAITDALRADREGR